MSKTMRQQIQADIKAHRKARLARGVDVGTSPHGLPADGLQAVIRPQAVTRQAGAALLHADPQAKRAGIPLIYRDPQVRGCCRAIKAAVLKQEPGRHYLALDDTEYLHLWFAIEHERSKTRKAIGKGLAVVGDLRATDSVWQKLAAIMNRRQQRRPA
ncbi:MAG: hypothetical protein Q8O64_05620 [Sideroxyarcus sp.]|nr:hypothetical protein [Sideroxyarcus sp.]